MTSERRRLAIALAVPLLTAACGGGGDADQSSPEAAVGAAYKHIATGEFEQACALVLPDARGAFSAAGSIPSKTESKSPARR